MESEFGAAPLAPRWHSYAAKKTPGKQIAQVKDIWHYDMTDLR